MHLSKEELNKLDNRKKANIINSITGIKPANLIGTKSNSGQSNLAIFNSLVHLGSNPALLGFILRPTGEVPRHTYENIKENGCYTINHIHTGIIEKSHYTSAKVDQSVSEFEVCGLTEEYLSDFSAPFVKESIIKMSMKYVEEMPIKRNGTIMVIGEVQKVIIPEAAVDEEGHVDLSLFNTAGISGLNSYYELKKLATFPYANPNEIPDFSVK